MKKSHLLAFCTSLSVCGCASHPSNPMDPLEPLNRTVYNFNDKLDRAVAKPVATAYRKLTPQPVRTGIGNFFDNILDAYSFVNDVLSAKPVMAMNDLMRFAINTTFGVFGLVDFATPMGLQRNKTTFGDTLASWGWTSSDYLVLPLLGPSTIRDGLGTVTTLVVSPDRRLVYREPAVANSAWTLSLVNTRERYLGLSDTLDEAAIDPYSYSRDAYLQARAAQISANRDASAVVVAPARNHDDNALDINNLVPADAQPSGENGIVSTPADGAASSAR